MPLKDAKKFSATGQLPPSVKHEDKPVHATHAKLAKALKMPLKHAKAFMKAAHKEKAGTVHTWSHNGEVKAEEKAMVSGNPEAPSQQGPAAQDSVVKKFIFNTLGTKNVV